MGLMSSGIAAYITLPFLVLENDNGGTGLRRFLESGIQCITIMQKIHAMGMPRKRWQ